MPRANLYKPRFPPRPECDRCGEKMSQVKYGDEMFTYCSRCGDPFPEDPRDHPVCEICGDVRVQEYHHLSYVFNTTIGVCRMCHGRIHDLSDHLSELQPVYKRDDAIKLGIFDPTRKP